MVLTGYGVWQAITDRWMDGGMDTSRKECSAVSQERDRWYSEG